MNPNIVIVMTDQQRADLRKGAGYGLDTMPFLDSWARGGTDFSAAYTPCPTCMPARVSMFTGRYPGAHRVRTNHNAEDVYYTEDMLDVLRGLGYETALCGKNHSHRNDRDFDFAETCGHLGHEGNRELDPGEEGFADFLDRTDHMEMHEASPGGVEVQHPYKNVSAAFSFLDKRSRDKPFFLWLSFAEPHNPYQVSQPYFDMFPPESLPPVAGPELLSAKGAKFSWLRSVWEDVLGDDIEKRILRARSNYHGMLRLIDDQFKRFIQGLDDRGLSRDTIVIFVSDHGDFAGEYGLIRKGPDLPEVLTRVPMVWRGPGIGAQGRVGRGFAGLTDIFPTLCDILGAELPVGVQGKSLRPLLEGGELPPGEYDLAYAENGFGGLYWDSEDSLDLVEEGASRGFSDGGRPLNFDCLNTWTQCGQVRMARKGNYKIQEDMLGSVYLYDLEKDPLECANLQADPAYLAVQADMLRELAAAMMRAQDPLPPPRRRYRLKQHPRAFWFQPYRV